MSNLYLNISSARHPIAGYVNVVMDDGAGINHNVINGLAFEDGCADGLFSEHFLEHLGRGQKLEFLRECRRVVKPEGVIRIAMHGPDTPARHGDMERDHHRPHDEEELTRIALMAGLEVLGRREGHEGLDPYMRGLGCPSRSRLIMEFRPYGRNVEAGGKPLVSVLIPAYRPEFFREALDSALRQTYRNTEIIICDDSSDDAIEQITGHTGDSRVSYVRNEKRLGGRYNYVKCLSLATGEFIKYLNDDDRLHPQCIERLVECFLSEPRLQLATSRRNLIDAAGRIMPQAACNQSLLHGDGVIEGRSLAGFVVASGINRIGEPSTTLFRREDVLHIRPHPFSFGGQELAGAGDIALWLNLLSRGDCAYVADSLSDFRTHENQHQRNPELRESAKDSWRQLRFHAERLGLFRAGTPLTLRVRKLDECVWHDYSVQDHNLHTGPHLKLEEITPERSHIRYQAAAQEYVHAYNAWCREHALTEADGQLMAERMILQWKHNPSIHLVTVFREGHEADLGVTLASLAGQLYQGWGLTVLAAADAPRGLFNGAPNMEWIKVGERGFTEAANAAIAATAADWAALIDPGDRLAPQALFTFADYVNLHPEWRAIYSDMDTLTADGNRGDPRFYPDFNLEMLRSRPYFGNFCLLHRLTLETLGGLRPYSDFEAYDAVFRMVETIGEVVVGHVPDVLLHRAGGNVSRREKPEMHETAHRVVAEHLRRSGIHAEIVPGYLPGTHFIEYRHGASPLVSVIIPTGDRPDLLKSCIESLFNKTGYPHYEVLVVDGNGTDPAVTRCLETLTSDKVRVLHRPHPYNVSAVCNYAAREARGEYLLLLNEDTQIVQPQWLERMLAQAVHPEVGIVGARLVSANQRVRHAGVVLGMGSVADHLHFNLEMDKPGYLGRAQIAQYFSAVTAACMMIRRSVYRECGGFDEVNFKTLFNDVDFCLKAGRRGYKTVWTPFATVVHHGSSTLGGEHPPRQSAQASTMFRKWLPELANDPAYNRNLALDHRDARIDTGVIATWNPDLRDRPRILAVTDGAQSAGHHRINGVLKALRGAALAQVASAPGPMESAAPSLTEVARLAPDTLIFQGCGDDSRIDRMEAYRRFLPGLRMILALDERETDDLQGAEPGARERLRRALAFTDRLIVRTEPWRRVCADLIDDIVVIPDRLERARWSGHDSRRRVGAKPRVGWVCGADDRGEAALMHAVIEATAGEFEWVLIGAWPAGLRLHTVEFNPGASCDRYPQALAALNLDLALAPLQVNRANETKSNLRLLEYGIMGWAVVCTDIEPYRAYGAPVARVANTPAGWIEAIRAHVHDPAACARAGDALRDWVTRHWMLEDHLDAWLDALTGERCSERARVSRGAG